MPTTTQPHRGVAAYLEEDEEGSFWLVLDDVSRKTDAPWETVVPFTRVKIERDALEQTAFTDHFAQQVGENVLIRLAVLQGLIRKQEAP